MRTCTAQKPLTTSLTKQQLLLFGKAARASAGSLMREATFCPDTLRLATDRFVRRRGRPKLEWASEIAKTAHRVKGSLTLDAAILDKAEWTTLVTNFCKNSVIE